MIIIWLFDLHLEIWDLCLNPDIPPSYPLAMCCDPELAIAIAKANQDHHSYHFCLALMILIRHIANLLDQQIGKGLTSKGQGPNQPKHINNRLRQANTMPTHANAMDDMGVAAFVCWSSKLAIYARSGSSEPNNSDMNYDPDWLWL